MFMKRLSGTRLLEWFLLSQALRDVRAAQASIPPSACVAAKHARLAAEVAERALDPAPPLPTPSGAAPVISLVLYVQAIRWALLSLARDASADDFSSLWNHAVAEGWLPLGEAKRDSLRDTLANTTFATAPELDEEACLALCQQARDVYQQLARVIEALESSARRLLLQRFLRTLLAVVLIGAIVYGGWLAIDLALRGPNLLEGKRWYTSSTLPDCTPSQNGLCQGKPVDIFFCTQHEENPWIVFDMSREEELSRVDITNRRDCCSDRALPLLIEVSSDQTTWREVARKSDYFYWTTLRFEPVVARYLRLRTITRRNALHLEQVAAYR